MSFSKKLTSLVLATTSLASISAFSLKNVQAQVQSNATCVIRHYDEIQHRAPCVFEQFGGDGSFRVSDPEGFHGKIAGSSYYEVKIQSPGVARARAYGAASRYRPLGKVYRSQRDPACWDNRETSICAY